MYLSSLQKAQGSRKVHGCWILAVRDFKVGVISFDAKYTVSLVTHACVIMHS